MTFSAGLARGAPVTCAWLQPQAAHFSTPSMLRAASVRQNSRGLSKPGENTLVARPRRRNVTANESDAKAILPEPRSVKKQFPISDGCQDCENDRNRGQQLLAKGFAYS